MQSIGLSAVIDLDLCISLTNIVLIVVKIKIVDDIQNLGIDLLYLPDTVHTCTRVM